MVYSFLQVFYLSNLLVYRAWGNLYVTAMLLLLFIEHNIMFKVNLSHDNDTSCPLPHFSFFILSP